MHKFAREIFACISGNVCPPCLRKERCYDMDMVLKREAVPSCSTNRTVSKLITEAADADDNVRNCQIQKLIVEVRPSLETIKVPPSNHIHNEYNKTLMAAIANCNTRMQSAHQQSGKANFISSSLCSFLLLVYLTPSCSFSLR